MIYYFLLSISLQTTHFIYMLNNVRHQRTNIKIFVLVNRWYHMALQGRKILPAYNSLRALAYISTFRSLPFVRRSARKSDTRREEVADGEVEVESTSWVARPSWGISMDYTGCVCREGSRNGGPDGVWCKEGDSI